MTTCFFILLSFLRTNHFDDLGWFIEQKPETLVYTWASNEIEVNYLLIANRPPENRQFRKVMRCKEDNNIYDVYTFHYKKGEN